MARLLSVFVVGALLLVMGCTPPWNTVVNPPNQGRYISETPTAAQLVARLNATSERFQSLECRDVDIKAKLGHQTIDVLGSMICQKQRDFRLKANVLGQPALDIG